MARLEGRVCETTMSIQVPPCDNYCFTKRKSRSRPLVYFWRRKLKTCPPIHPEEHDLDGIYQGATNSFFSSIM